MDAASPARVVGKKPAPPRRRPDSAYAGEARRQGYRTIAGVDEVGCGPLAGPVVAAAVILPPDYDHPYLDDSKRVPPERRHEIRLHLISAKGVFWAVGEASVEEIDQLNIYHARLLAMKRAVEALSVAPDFLLIDGNRGLRGPVPERPLVGGDGRCSSIAAASIIAKEHRDELMVRLHEVYPHYGFARHKGYGTAAHRKALENHGPSPVHRRTFLRPGPAAEPVD